MILKITAFGKRAISRCPTLWIDISGWWLRTDDENLATNVGGPLSVNLKHVDGGVVGILVEDIKKL